MLIKCLHRSDELRFSEREGLSRPDGSEYYRVTMTGQGLLASLSVYAFEPHGRLDNFFAKLAVNWRGWSGEKKWSSLEGEFSLSCTSDRLGHIAIEAVLKSRSGGGGWEAQNTFHVEAGQLDRIAAEMKQFFSVQAAI